MKIKYVKLESPSGVPTYKRPTTIPGFNFANTENFRTLEQFIDDLKGSDASKIVNLINENSGLVSFDRTFELLGKYRMYQFRDLNSIGAIKYGSNYHYFKRSGQGMMSRIGNSYAIYNMYNNGHKLLNMDGSNLYEWQSIWNGNGDGKLAGVLEENQFIKNDGTTTPFDLNVEYSFGYYMCMNDNITSHGSASLVEENTNLFTGIEGTPPGCIYSPLLVGARWRLNVYTHREDGAHGIKDLCILGLKFYNVDGTTSVYEAEVDKPYSTVYGEYPFVPQSFSHMNFKHTKPYTKVTITRRYRNDLRGSAAALSEISYPFITVSSDTRKGSIDRKDILENELVLGGNYPAGTSKDAYTSYELYTDMFPDDISEGMMLNQNILDSRNITSLYIQDADNNSVDLIFPTEKTTLTNNGDKSDIAVLNKTFGNKFKCFDVHIKTSLVYDAEYVATAGSFTNSGADGFPFTNSGGCPGPIISTERR